MPHPPTPRPLTPGYDVVSFPTPSTSDLLVVQDVDTRLPGYTPANYGDPHPDTVTYPNLKLVFQTPLDNENNFMWIRRVYANERFNQEAYNYALKYSGEDPTKPIYVRTYLLPRATYTPITKGTPDPIYSSAVLVEESTDRIKDDQTDGQTDSLFIKVTRVYETIPGPGLTTIKYGGMESIPAKFQAAQNFTTTEATVDPSTQPDDTDGTILASQVKQVSVAKAQKSTTVLDNSPVTLTGEKITPQQQVATVTEVMVPTGSGQDVVVADALTVEGSVENLGNGQSVVTKVEVPSVFPETQLSREKPLWGIPMKFKVADPPLKTSSVVEGTVSEGDVSLSSPQDMDASSEQITEFKKKITSSSMSGESLSLTGSQTGQWGVETVSEALDYSQPTIVTAPGIKSDESEPTGDGRYVRKTVNYPSSPVTLTEYHTDETYRITVRMDKSLVALDNGYYTLPTAGANEAYELKVLDPSNGILIHSYVEDVPDPETWSHTVHYSFPDELLEAGVYYESSTDENSGSGGVNNSGLNENTNWKAESRASAKAAMTAVPYTKYQAGYSGPCAATTTRTYYLSPPDTPPTVEAIVPVIGSIVITGTSNSQEVSSYVSGQGTSWIEDGGTQGSSLNITAIRHNIGPCVHGGITLVTYGETTVSTSSSSSSGSIPGSSPYPASSASASGSLSAVLELPDSSTPIESGDTLIVGCTTEKWRFGVWIQEVTTITRP